jgi:hypothetical protein
MAATLTNVLVVGIWVILGLGIFAFAIYITFFPLVRTLGGGLFALKQYRRESALEHEAFGMIPDAQLGFTMADGGDAIEDATRGDDES